MALAVMSTGIAVAVPLDSTWDLAAVAGKPVTIDSSGNVTFTGVGDAGARLLSDLDGSLRP